ncbi:MAG: Mur ligase domain-containing protein [Myxococcota bacterium]
MPQNPLASKAAPPDERMWPSKPPREVYLMGIGGIAMGSFAGLLREAGHAVRGSDAAIYPPMQTYLAKWGIPVRTPYDAANLTPKPDLVVVGNVIRRDNPEAAAARGLQLPMLSLPQALWRLFLRPAHRVAVCGTHGKTTCTALLAHVLRHAGEDPGFLVGGIVRGLETSFSSGSLQPGGVFVVEADEYDTAYFDKSPKFLHYRPQVLLATSLEFDHADIYDSLDAIAARFGELFAGVGGANCHPDERSEEGPLPSQGGQTHVAQPSLCHSRAGGNPARNVRFASNDSHVQGQNSPFGLDPRWSLPLPPSRGGDDNQKSRDDRQKSRHDRAVGIVACSDEPRLMQTVRRARPGVPVITYGQTGDWQAREIRATPRGTSFIACYRGKPVGPIHSRLWGPHNVQNVLGCTAVLARLGLTHARIAAGVRTFAGVARRLELVGERGDRVVLDDFAHHPTAVAKTLQGVRARYPDRLVWALFEPRSATSCRRTFQQDYVAALAHADRVFIAPTGRELPPGQSLDTRQLARDISQRGVPAFASATLDELVETVVHDAPDPVVVVCMSNGAFGGVPQRIARRAGLLLPHS